MTKFYTRAKISDKVIESGDIGITAAEISEALNIAGSNTHRHLKELELEGTLKRINHRWYDKYISPVEIKKGTKVEGKNALVLKCIKAHHTSNTECSVYSIMTITGIGRDYIHRIVYKLRKNGLVVSKGRGENTTYKYVADNEDTSEVVTKAPIRYDTCSEMGEKCYLLLQALGTIDIDKVANCFTISRHEADQLIREVVKHYHYMLSNVTIAIK